MTIRGRYLEAPEENARNTTHRLAGGIKIYFGGIEFRLTEAREKGIFLTDIDGSFIPVNPEFINIEGNMVRFGLPGGTALVFTSTQSMWRNELQIEAEFADDISSINLPIKTHRSVLISENEHIGVSYNGANYFLDTQGDELLDGKLIFSRDNAYISYHTRGRLRAFDPDYFVVQNLNHYESDIVSWRNSNFNHWRQNASGLQYEDDVISYLSESLHYGNYTAAVASIPRGFRNSAQRTYKSSVFLGGMSAAYNSLKNEETDKIIRITNLIREGSLEVLKEEYIIDYLFTRGNNALAYGIVDLIHEMTMEMISPEYCAGLLEVYMDLKRWRPSLNCPVTPMIEEILLSISGSLVKDTKNNLVYISNGEGYNNYYSLRLGKALIKWTDTSNHTVLENIAYRTSWEKIGRSLVLSALASGEAGSGKLHSILNPTDYYPKEVWLSDNGHWAWTVSPSVSLLNIDGNLNFSFLFPANMAHYIIIRGVRPFIKIQIHGMDWRTDSQFEIYDSSGWVYYQQDQILVLKLRHRQAIENVTIFYRVEAPPPPARVVEPVIVPRAEENNNAGAAGGNTVDQ